MRMKGGEKLMVHGASVEGLAQRIIPLETRVNPVVGATRVGVLMTLP